MAPIPVTLTGTRIGAVKLHDVVQLPEGRALVQDVTRLPHGHSTLTLTVVPTVGPFYAATLTLPDRCTLDVVTEAVA